MGCLYNGQHAEEPLPDGYFHNGRQYVCFDGEKTDHHPLLEEFAASWLEVANAGVVQHNAKLAQAAPLGELFGPVASAKPATPQKAKAAPPPPANGAPTPGRRRPTTPGKGKSLGGGKSPIGSPERGDGGPSSRWRLLARSFNTSGSPFSR